MKTSKLWVAALLMTAGAFGQTSPAWDTSGNGLLKGTYYIRQVLWQLDPSASGDLQRAASVYGQITFSGTGTYTFNGSNFDTGAGSANGQAYTATGTYSISASGYGFMDSLYSNESVYGLVSQGIFVGSSTENASGAGAVDMVVAAPLASPLPTASSFKGNYTFVNFDSPTGSPFDTRSSLFTLSADGIGTLTGTTAGTGFVGGNGGAVTRQNLSNVKYLFSNGGGNIQFPTVSAANLDTTLISGNHYVYFSPDGNFFFGGSPTGWDMIVGVRTPAGTAANFNGLYYQAGMDQDESNLLQFSVGGLDGYFGSFKASNGVILNHQRPLFFSPVSGNISTFDFTFQDGYTFNSDGSSDDNTTGQHYIYGNNGAIRIGLGVPSANNFILGISVALAAPTFSGTGPFIDPTGLVNAGSYALSTAQFAPGEYVSIFGSGLSNKSDANGLDPTTLDGVQVLVDGIPAPVYLVSPNQISFVIPYVTPAGVVSIQVNNNGKMSNIVTNFLGDSQPGHFTQGANGISAVGARHLDGSLITAANPAQPSETISVYMTGLGAVTPTIADGAITAARYDNTVLPNVFINGATATVGFSGLAGGAVSENQLNITIPTGVPAGSYFLEVLGDDSDNFESPISIGSGSVGVNAVPEVQTVMRAVRPHASSVRRPSTRKAAEPPSDRPMQRVTPNQPKMIPQK